MVLAITIPPSAIIEIGFLPLTLTNLTQSKTSKRKEVLKNSGNISHKQAVEKAESEYEKYRIIQDQQYISSMDEFYNKYLEENKSDK